MTCPNCEKAEARVAELEGRFLADPLLDTRDMSMRALATKLKDAERELAEARKERDEEKELAEHVHRIGRKETDRANQAEAKLIAVEALVDAGNSRVEKAEALLRDIEAKAESEEKLRYLAVEEIHRLEDQLEQAEASAALAIEALRQAEHCAEHNRCHVCRCWAQHATDCIVGKALSSSSGKALLEYVGELEASLSKWSQRMFMSDGEAVAVMRQIIVRSESARKSWRGSSTAGEEKS